MQKRDYKKQFEEKFDISMAGVWDGKYKHAYSLSKDMLWSWFESIIKQERDEVIKEGKGLIKNIPDTTTIPDKYYRKYTNNWRSQNEFTGRTPSGRAWIMWFLDKLHSQSK